MDSAHTLYVTWIAKRDHFRPNICDLICEKSSLWKHLKKNSFVYIQLLYMHNYSICMQNCFLICFNSGFSQVRSRLFWHEWSLFANPVTYVFYMYIICVFYHIHIRKMALSNTIITFNKTLATILCLIILCLEWSHVKID